jgi:hypothetical protein
MNKKKINRKERNLKRKKLRIKSNEKKPEKKRMEIEKNMGQFVFNSSKTISQNRKTNQLSGSTH